MEMEMVCGLMLLPWASSFVHCLPRPSLRCAVLWQPLHEDWTSGRGFHLQSARLDVARSPFSCSCRWLWGCLMLTLAPRCSIRLSYTFCNMSDVNSGSSLLHPSLIYNTPMYITLINIRSLKSYANNTWRFPMYITLTNIRSLKSYANNTGRLMYITLTNIRTGGIPYLLFHTSVSCTRANYTTKTSLP